MRAQDFDGGYYSPDKDDYTMQKLHDTRRPKITLTHLNQLNRMRSAKTLENLVRRDLLGMLYGSPEGGAEGGMGGGLGGMPGM